MNKKRKNTIYFLLFGILLIGVVYAILQANLQINGTAKISDNEWDVHFENVQVIEDSVAIGTGDTAATIDPNNPLKVDFEVTLSLPGDFYEFTVDVVNAGTIDAMIGSLEKKIKVNEVLTEIIPEYLNYSVTYFDGVEIQNNHKLLVDQVETYKVRLEFKSDINSLPHPATISTSLEPLFIQADNSAIRIQHIYLYDVLSMEARNGHYAKEYLGEHKDSFSIEGEEKIYHWFVNNNEDVNYVSNKNNVIFANYCWLIIRTTDTGGVKILYNGVPTEGTCNSTGNSTHLGEVSYHRAYKSLAGSGYMYNASSIVEYLGNTAPNSGAKFANSVDYYNQQYHLVDLSDTYDNNHHYTCNTTDDVCSSVNYYYLNNYYTSFSNGNDVDKAMIAMLSASNTNTNDSAVKAFLDNWYVNHLTSYADKLEDTIFCNDRKIRNYGGWVRNGDKSNRLVFNENSTTTDLTCFNINDQFSISNQSAHLLYPIGLLTLSEVNLVNSLLFGQNGAHFWLMTPKTYDSYPTVYYITNRGEVESEYVYYSYGARPAISLKPGIQYIDGDGSKDNPYVIEQ